MHDEPVALRGDRPPGDPTPVPSSRATWRAVALPREHGGWGLTLEPVLLGLLLAPSIAGAALGIAAFVAFVARTPIGTVLVDLRRHRLLDRTRLAAGIAAVELAALGVLALVAGLRSGWLWLVPVAIAVPFVAIELAFDARSRSRRLVPELAGALGIAAVGSAMIVAGGGPGLLALGAWAVLAGRNVAAIPFVRTEIRRLRGRDGTTGVSDAAQVVGVAIAFGAALVDARLVGGALAVAALALLHAVWVRRPPVPAKVLGLTQMILGVAVVGVTAAGVTLA